MVKRTTAISLAQSSDCELSQLCRSSRYSDAYVCLTVSFVRKSAGVVHFGASPIHLDSSAFLRGGLPCRSCAFGGYPDE